MYKTILVPVDGSAMATKALDSAIALSQTFGASLVTLCVYRHHSPLEASFSMVRAQSESQNRPDDALKSYASEIASAAKERARAAGVADVYGYAKRGQPSRAIVEFSRQHGVDLIVMGARGTGDIEGFLLGSVSYKVSSLASVPCLIVR
ncbi:universal stress protein [Fulvimarina sp. 2208YS6-2-32]|uniref:Universal stress protein n=1 Tax=Fulvimarina uroteuthidis TaxID=3098149 RepID=A0ABU5I0F5_9HYPH|nr:universal stress protein [Fulvimarina sp. 2208YS6-2-32]MDY8108832.1 universal stress protein [Fulvimarina sp. 2208YS6-2-32]